jgi:hypothetical protein
MTVSAYTAVALLCRKLLMNVANDQGAPAGQQFITYVDFLDDKKFIPPGGRPWVDHVRKQGNFATHDIPQPSEDEAKRLLTFVGALLQFVYELPAKLNPPVEDDEE